jgi:hypothetical protein
MVTVNNSIVHPSTAHTHDQPQLRDSVATNIIRMASDSNSDWDLFSASQDYEVILETGSDYVDGVTLSESLEFSSSPPSSGSVGTCDSIQSSHGTLSEDEIQFGHLLQHQMIKLEDLHDSSEITLSSPDDSDDIPLDELRETIEDSSSTIFLNHIPEFDRLPNLPYEIVERARSVRKQSTHL